MCPVTRFFAVQTILSFWWDSEKFPQKSVPSHTFLRCGDYLKILRGLGKFRQKGVTSYTFFSQCRLGHRKILETILRFWGEKFHKKCAQFWWDVLFAVETNLSFCWDSEKFPQKSVPSHKNYLKFLWDLEKSVTVFVGTLKNFHKKVRPVTRFFAVETILRFWGDLESFDKKVWPVTHFFRSADYLKFLMGLGKFRQKMCDQLHGFSQCRLSQVFDGTWKNFHKKSVPSHRFFRCTDYLKFLMGLGKIFTKKCAQSHVSSLWRLTWVFDAT